MLVNPSNFLVVDQQDMNLWLPQEQLGDEQSGNGIWAVRQQVEDI